MYAECKQKGSSGSPVFDPAMRADLQLSTTLLQSFWRHAPKNLNQSLSPTALRLHLCFWPTSVSAAIAQHSTRSPASQIGGLQPSRQNPWAWIDRRHEETAQADLPCQCRGWASLAADIPSKMFRSARPPRTSPHSTADPVSCTSNHRRISSFRTRLTL